MKSEIKKLSAEIERLQNENELKSAWISLLSHDFKEIFGSLIWLTEAVESETIAIDNFFKLLPRIKQDAKKNLQTVTDINEWFKTQISGFKPENSNLLALDLFIKLKTKFAQKLAAKNINFQFQGDESLIFNTDSFLVSVVLEKLLDNAIKYSHTDKPIHFEAVKANNTTILSIIDYGVGMELEIQKCLSTFQSPVFSGTNGEIGAGLGLHIVRNFVSLMQGKIEIDSTHNVGTKITIVLPQIEK